MKLKVPALGYSYNTHPPVSREHSIYQSDEVGEGALEGELLDDGVTEDGGGIRGTDVHVSSKWGDGKGGREILQGLDVCETSIHIVLGEYRGVIFLACFKQHVGLVYFWHVVTECLKYKHFFSPRLYTVVGSRQSIQEQNSCTKEP